MAGDHRYPTLVLLIWPLFGRFSVTFIDSLLYICFLTPITLFLMISGYVLTRGIPEYGSWST